jgi:hypothetical protein
MTYIYGSEDKIALRVGMPITEVISLLGRYYVKRKSFFDNSEYYMWFDDGARLYLDKENKIDAIEFFFSAHFIFDGVDLFETTLENIRNILKVKDPDLESDEGTGFSSTRLRIKTWNESGLDHLDAEPDSIMVYFEKYFNIQSI